jgi:hypothetical protein
MCGTVAKWRQFSSKRPSPFHMDSIEKLLFSFLPHASPVRKKKGITAIQEDFPCNPLSPLYATVSSGCDIILTTNFDTLLMIQCKDSHA